MNDKQAELSYRREGIKSNKINYEKEVLGICDCLNERIGFHAQMLSTSRTYLIIAIIKEIEIYAVNVTCQNMHFVSIIGFYFVQIGILSPEIYIFSN